MAINPVTADKIILVWNQIKNRKVPNIEWDYRMNCGDKAIELCRQEKLILHTTYSGDPLDADRHDRLFLDKRYGYGITDISKKGDMLAIVLDNGDECLFKILNQMQIFDGGMQ